MFGTILEDTASHVTAHLSDVVDELQNLSLTSLPDEKLLDVLGDLETQRWRLASVDHAESPRSTHGVWPATGLP